VRRSARRRQPPRGFFDAAGLPVTVEESRALALVDFEILLRTGAALDPAGKEGLTRAVFRTLRMGMRGVNSASVEERIASLGGALGFEISTSFVRVHGAVIKRNIEPFFALVTELLREPAFRAKDLAQVKRATRAELHRVRDNDRALAGRWFRRTIYAGHPYGRPLAGTADAISRLTVEDLRAHHRKHLVASNILVGFSGDIDRPEAEGLVAKYLSGLSRRKAPTERLPRPKKRAGRHVVVVDKPARTQTQICIGTLGIAVGDPRYFPLQVANTAFGGTFTSTLMQEVREKRGWSYGVHSRFGADRQRETFTMWSHPGVSDAVDCIALELDLLDRWVGGELRQKQISFAKKYLLNSHCFEVDTATKRLEPRLDVELFGLPHDYWERYEEQIRGVKLGPAKTALAEVLSPDDLIISLTATADDVVPGLEALPGVRSVEVIPYDTP